MNRVDLRAAVWFVAGATPLGMLVIFILGLSGRLDPGLATVDMIILLVVGVACQAIARYWKRGP